MDCYLLFLLIPVVTDARSLFNVTKRATTEENIQAIHSRYTTGSKGWASSYGEYPVGTGACSLDPLPDVQTQKGWIKVAAGQPDYQKSLGCGMCLKVEASGKPVGGRGSVELKGTYYAVVVDLCGACGQGDLDFYTPGDGKWEISFDAVDCPDVSGSKGNIQYRFTGSNGWYLKLQIANSKLPTAAVEFFKDGKWHCAKRTDDNHFVWSGVGKIDFPLRTRLTSVAGETVGGDIPKLINDKDQDSGFQYKKFKEASGGSPPQLPCHGQGELKRDGKADDVTNQGQGSSGGGGSSKPATKKPAPETKPPPETKPSAETKPPPEAKPAPETKPTPEAKQEEKWTSANIDDFCKTKDAGTYGDPTDCTYFIQCANSKTYRKQCPKGLEWNDKIKNCDHAANAKCSGQKEKAEKESEKFDNDDDSQNKTTEQTTTNTNASHDMKDNEVKVNWCKEHRKNLGRYPDPSDCRKFIMCNGTGSNAYRCPDGFLYDQYRHNCRTQSYVDCSHRGTPFLENKIPMPAQETSKNLYSISGEESKDSYVIPDVQRGISNQDLSERLIDNSKPAMKTGGTSFCLGKLDGFYPLESDCRGFYKCSRGITKVKHCPEGLRFNAVEEVCDWPKHVPC